MTFLIVDNTIVSETEEDEEDPKETFVSWVSFFFKDGAEEHFNDETEALIFMDECDSKNLDYKIGFSRQSVD